WDLSGEAPAKRTTLHVNGGEINSLAFSLDGGTLAAGSRDKMVRLWDLAGTKLRQRAVLETHQGEVHAVSFAPDGRTLASASTDKTIRLWDLGGTPSQGPAALERDMIGWVLAMAFIVALVGKLILIGWLGPYQWLRVPCRIAHPLARALTPVTAIQGILAKRCT